MALCKFCGNAIADNLEICPACGSPVKQEIETETNSPHEMEQFTYHMPVSQPEDAYEPEPTKTGKVMGIIGMIFGIYVLVNGAGFIISSLLFPFLCMIDYYDPDIPVFLGTTFMFTDMILGVISFIGIYLGKKANQRGNHTKVPNIATKLGSIALILSIASIIVVSVTLMIFQNIT